MTPNVKTVKVKADYLLSIEFSNGEKGMLDMKPYLDFGVFTKLRQQADFEKVFVSFGTLEWESGADLAPEFVYEKSLKTVNA
jgi:hypothetical protein